jgi:hypothetical protein
MSSSVASCLIDSDSNQSDSRGRSPSSSSMSRTPLAVVRQPNSRRSQTPKANRKTVSNRSRPYVAAASPHSNQTTASSITFDDDRTELEENVDVSSSNRIMDRRSTNAIASHLSPRPDQSIQLRDAFERSSEDDREVSDREMSKLQHRCSSFRLSKRMQDFLVECRPSM